MDDSPSIKSQINPSTVILWEFNKALRYTVYPGEQPRILGVKWNHISNERNGHF